MHKNRTILLFGLSIVTSLLVIGVFIFFLIIIKNKNEHTKAVLTTLENKNLKKLNASAITQKITRIEDIHKVVDSYFVNPNEIDSFVNYLENIGTNTNTVVNVESVAVLTTIKNTIAVKISAEGDFSNIMHTIQLLENAPYKIHVQQIYLNKRIQTITQDLKDVPKTKEILVWHVDISFVVLIS